MINMGREYKYPYTKFGEFLVKLQKKFGENMIDMADRLNVSAQFISNVAHGSKGVPKDWVDRLVVLYRLPDNQADRLRHLAEESQVFYPVSAKNVSSIKRMAALSFSKKFANMDDKTAKKIVRLLG